MKQIILNIQDTFNKELSADTVEKNFTRQVKEASFSFVRPQKSSNPQLIHVSQEMLDATGVITNQIKTKEFTNFITGNKIYKNTQPYAMCYGGHQFGQWAGQLGDGRAINLCEVVHQNKRWALQLKGAGKTPYSRSGDGRAVLRSSIREYLCSEAMYHLEIPTTRALSLAITGDTVLRDVLYDGNPAYEKGAIVCRAAPSFIRFGNFELHAIRGEYKSLKRLTDYTIKYFFPHLGTPTKESYINFFKEVTFKTLNTLIHWQRVGFVHGVLNTDNMSILGLTIDYGPYGWLEEFDFNWTPNITDATYKRYRYGNQPSIVLWNLYQLANALYPLIDEITPLEAILEEFKMTFERDSLQMMRNKLGLETFDKQDIELISELEKILQLTETDMTIFFRKLSIFKGENVEEEFKNITGAFYYPRAINKNVEVRWKGWLKKYGKRLQQEQSDNTVRAKKMNRINPKYVLRNYMAYMAIEEATKGNYNIIDELHTILKKPYDEQPEYQKWFTRRPRWAKDKVGCSMLSCSS